MHDWVATLCPWKVILSSHENIRSWKFDFFSKLEEFWLKIDSEVQQDSPVRPGVSVAHVPLYPCSYAPCLLDCQNYLTHEGPEGEIERERERQGMNGSWEYCSYSCTTMGTVLSFETLCPIFCVSPCDQTIILGNFLPRPSKTKWVIEKVWCLENDDWFLQQAFGIADSPLWCSRRCAGGLHIRGEMSHKQKHQHSPAELIQLHAY